MIAGVAKALAAMAKTISEPDRMPGMICGRMTRRNMVKGPAPSETAAWETRGSSRCSEVQTEITMKGSATCTRAMTTPWVV